MFVCSLIKPRLKIKKFEFQTFWIVPLVCALILLISRVINPTDAGEALIKDSTVNPIKILILFFSMTFISTLLDEAGFFSYLASKAAKNAQESQIKLFIIIYLLISILTIFTSNDVIVITFTPFLIYFTKRAKINPIPYLFMGFVAANTWSMLFIIGNPTNIYIAQSLDVNFIEYVKVMALPTVFAGLISFGVMFALFYKKLKQPIECVDSDISPIKNKVLCYVSLGVLIATLICMVISDFVNIEMWLVSLIGAFSLFCFVVCYGLVKNDVFESLNGAVKRLPYGVIPFIISMFIFVFGLTSYSISESYASLINKLPYQINYGLFGLLTCNVINNIPMSVLFTDLIRFAPETTRNFALYSSVIASNIGAFLTPFGALAGIMFMSIVKNGEVDFKFKNFIVYGSITGMSAIIAAIFGLIIIF